MAVQAPNTRLGQPRQYGLEDRIRELMAQRGVEPVENPGDELAPFRTDETQRIVRDGEREVVPTQDSTPTADDIIRDEQGPRPAPPRPFPSTSAERVADLRRQLQPQVDALRARANPGPAMIVDGEVDPEIELPDPSLGFKPKPVEMPRTPKPGATQTGGFYVAPGRAAEGGRALGDQQKAERQKQEKASAEKAKNEADLLKEDEDLDSWAAGEDGKPGTDDDNMLFKPDPATGELVNTGRDHPKRLDEDGRRLDRPQGVGDVAFTPAAPGTGYRARKPGQERRLGANEQEQGVPMTDRRLPDAAGDRPPMLPGKGQSVVRDGGMSPRAPQQGIIDSIPPELMTSQPPKDQGQFFKWREAMKALAVASGINIAAFENEEDLVRAGASIAKQNERMSAPVRTRVPKTNADGETLVDPNGNVILTSQQAVDKDGNPVSKYERTITSTGAPVFTPSDDMRKSADAARRRAAARQFVREHKPDEATGSMIIEAADMGDFDTVDSLVRGARRDRTASTAQAAMDQARLRGQTQQMNNPNINRAMFHNSVMRQPNAAGVAQVATGWGAAGGIPAMISAEAVAADKANRDAVLKNNVDVAEATAEGRKKPTTPDTADFLTAAQTEAQAALAGDLDANWSTARNRLRLKYSDAKKAGADVEIEQADYHIAGLIAAKGLYDHPAVVEALQTLYSKMFPGGLSDIGGAIADDTMREEWQTRTARFMAQTRAMNIPDDRAQQFLDSQK